MLNSDAYKNAKIKMQKGITERLAIKQLARLQQLDEAQAKIHMTLMQVKKSKN